jgi:hypothetical protein
MNSILHYQQKNLIEKNQKKLKIPTLSYAQEIIKLNERENRLLSENEFEMENSFKLEKMFVSLNTFDIIN